jgi:hypothetical protein
MGGKHSTRIEVKNIVETKIKTYIDNIYKTINDRVSNISSQQITKQRNKNSQECSTRNNFTIGGDLVVADGSKFTNDQQSFASCALRSTVQFSTDMGIRTELINNIQQSITGDTSLTQSIAQLQKAMSDASTTEKNTGGIEGVINKLTDKAFSMGQQNKSETEIENELRTEFESHITNTTDIENKLETWFANLQKNNSTNVCGVKGEADNNFSVDGNVRVLNSSSLTQHQTTSSNSLIDCATAFINIDGMMNTVTNDDSFTGLYQTMIKNQAKNTQDTQSEASTTKIQDNVINEAISSISNTIQGIMKNIVIIIIIIAVIVIVAIIFFMLFKLFKHKHQTDNNFVDYYGPSHAFSPLSATPMGPPPMGTLPMGPPPM